MNCAPSSRASSYSSASGGQAGLVTAIDAQRSGSPRGGWQLRSTSIAVSTGHQAPATRLPRTSTGRLGPTESAILADVRKPTDKLPRNFRSGHVQRHGIRQGRIQEKTGGRTRAANSLSFHVLSEGERPILKTDAAPLQRFPGGRSTSSFGPRGIRGNPFHSPDPPGFSRESNTVDGHNRAGERVSAVTKPPMPGAKSRPRFWPVVCSTAGSARAVFPAVVEQEPREGRGWAPGRIFPARMQACSHHAPAHRRRGDASFRNALVDKKQFGGFLELSGRQSAPSSSWLGVPQRAGLDAAGIRTTECNGWPGRGPWLRRRADGFAGKSETRSVAGRFGRFGAVNVTPGVFRFPTGRVAWVSCSRLAFGYA